MGLGFAILIFRGKVKLEDLFALNSLLNYKYPSVHADTPSVISYKSFANYFFEKNYQKNICGILVVFCSCSELCSPASTPLRYLPCYSCRRVRIKFSKYFLMPCIKHAMGNGEMTHVFLLGLARFIAGVGLKRHLKTSNKLAVWEVDTFAHSLNYLTLCIWLYWTNPQKL